MKLAVSRVRVAFVLVMISGWASVLSAQSTSACSDSTTDQSRGSRDYYGTLVSAPDTQVVRVRTQLGLPTLLNSQVRIVGDTTVCRAASNAYDAYLASPRPNQPVLVLEVGTKRIVSKDIGFRGGVLLNLLFDQTFTTVLDRMWH